MRRAATLVLLSLSPLLGACGDEGPEAVPAPAGSNDRWEAIAASLPDEVDPSSQNVCGRGGPACIDAVATEMDRRFRALAAACDHNAPFALMYMRVTENVAANPERFRDPTYLNHLDTVFATLYFDAIDAWRRGETGAVPEAWRIAFEATGERRLSVLGDLLLGMNAHISRDLPFAVERAGTVNADGDSAERDFNTVNEILGEVQGPMLEEQSQLFDPSLTDQTMPALDIGGSSFAELMADWRTEAFENGLRLIDSQGAGREAIVAEIEAAAAGRARLIEALTSNLVIGPGEDERRSYCEGSGG